MNLSNNLRATRCISLGATCIAPIACLLVYASLSTAQTSPQTNAQHDTARQDDAEQLLDIHTKQEQSGLAKLHRLNRESAQLVQEIGSLKQRIARENKDLKQISENSSKIQSELDVQEEQVMLLLRQIYLAGAPSAMRLWFSPGALRAKDRLIEYHNRILDARHSVIQNYQDKFQAQRLLHQKQEKLIVVLEQLSARHHNKRKALQVAQAQTQDAIERAREQREALYQQIARRKKIDVEVNIPFVNRRGALQSPIEGQITDRFGQKYLGGLVWHGWEIKAQNKQTVRAVHDGKILFMQHNKLMGLLIVIDHGDDYLSIYAHNHKALKKAGDEVRARESIAVIDKPGTLYFGLLHGDAPLDPKPWVRL